MTKYKYTLSNSENALQVDTGKGYFSLPHGESVIIDDIHLVDMLCKIRGITLTSVDKMPKKAKKIKEEML